MLHIRQTIIIALLSIPSFLIAQTHEYLFNNSLNSISGGPALTELLTCGATTGSYGVQSIVNSGNCLSFDAYCFNRGGGFQYSNPGIISGTYTISIYFKFLPFSGYSRVIDFSNGTLDWGVYIFGDCLVSYGGPNLGPCPNSYYNNFHLITFVRNGSTDVVSVYIDGVFHTTFNDFSYIMRPATSTSPINFFTDNNCESDDGCITYISVSPIMATASDISLLYSNMPTINQAVNNSPPNVSITPSSVALNCSVTSATLTASGGVSYSWSNGLPNTTSNVVNTPNTYTITATDANGCTASASSTVIQNITPPTATVSPSSSTVTCAIPNVLLTASGGGTYNWGGGITTTTRTVNAPGTYTVTVTGSNGCTATASSIIGLNTTAPTASVSPNSASVTCASPSIILTASGGGTYNWGGGITTAANTVSSANTYTVTVTGANGCTATANSVINQNITPPVASISPASFTLTCSNTSTTLTASGGGTYNWGGGNTTASNNVSSPNTYTVTVTGANGCTATAIATVSQNITPPVASVSPSSATLTCGTPSTTLTANGGGTYNWGGGLTTATNTVNTANTYIVTVTAANGCTATASSIVNQNFTPPVAAINPSSFTLTCLNPSTTLTASGGGTYNWGGGTTTSTNSVNLPNTYSVTVTDVNGCTASAASVVSQNITPPTASVSPTSATITCASPSVVLTASGGGTYSWGGGITTSSNTVAGANTYTVTVTAANGCTATASSVVSLSVTPPVASISPSSATLTCANPSVTLIASGGGTYDWGGGNTTTTKIVSSPGTYTVTVTAANSCTATASVIVSQNNTPPVVSVSPSSATLTCISGSVTLTASGGGTYNWGGGITTATNTVNTASTYSVTVTDANGCTASASSVVAQNIIPPVAAINPSNGTLTCITSSVTLTASGGGTYNWGGGVTTATNPVALPNTYTVTVTDATNGCTATASSVINQNITAPAATINPASGTLTCTTTSITLNASGGGTYNWGGGIATANNSVSIPNTYTVTVTDALNGCTATASSIISQSVTVPPAAVSPTSATLTCATTSATLTASGGISYNWGSGVTTTTNTVSIPNTYTVTVTDVNGCTGTASAVVNQNVVPPIASVSPSTGAITCITNSILLTATGGGAYDWGGGNATNTNSVTVANTYTVTVTDATNGCTATASSVISQNTTPPVASINPSTAILTCTTTSVNLIASGGGAYDWGAGITTANNSVSTPNTYTVTVTDGTNGCTSTASSVVSQNIAPPVAAVSPATATITCTAPSVLLTASGGGTYDWGAGVVTATNTVSSPNTYTVTVTAANGCTATASSVVNQSVTVPPAAISPATVTLTCTTTSTTLTASGGVSYNWGAGISTASNTVSIPNTYTVTVTDVNGCTATASSVVSQDILPPVASVSPSSATLTCVTTSVSLTASGGGSYDWGGGNITNTNTATVANTYSVTVTDAANGCTALASTVVSQNINPPAAAITPANGTLTCTTASINLVASGGGTYDWGGGITTANNSVSSPNTYTVTVTDGVNGCTSTASSIIGQNITPPVAAVSPVNATLTCSVVSITLTGSGGVSYNWGGSVTSITNNVNQPNTYSVTVTDSNGCTATASSVVSQDIATPNVSIAALGTLDCAVLNTTLTASSTTNNATFNWGSGNTTTTYSVSTGGNYTVTVTDPTNGCTASASVNVVQNITAPNLSVAVSGILSCVNATVTVTASSTTANATFNWGGGNTTTTNTVSATGNYTVTATDPVNSCTASASQAVLQNITAPTVSIATPQDLNCVNAAVTLTASSTTANVTYDWGGGVNTATNTVATPASYSVTATDPVNGCTASISANVIQNITAPVASIALPDTVNCHHLTVTLTASSSAVNSSYSWGSGNTLSTYNVSAAGNYPVTVTDNNNGCTASTSVDVIAIPLMSLSETHTNISCFSFSDGAINLSVAGGLAPFTYNWNTGAVTEDISSTPAGNYLVTVTDDIVCTATIAVVLTEPPSILVTEVHTDVTCFGFNDGTINVTVSAGTPAYAYRWNDLVLTEDRNNLAPGTYTVTVTDANQCSVSATAVVTEPTALNVQQQVTQPTCESLPDDGNISVVATGGINPISFVWSNGVTVDHIDNMGVGNYDLTVTDANGCSVTSSFQLTYIYNFVVDAMPFTTINMGDNIQLSYTLTGNTGNYSSVWTPDYGLSCADCSVADASPIYSTLYKATVTNNVGCVASDTVTIRVVPKYDVFVPNVFTPNDDNVNETFQIFGRINALEYLQIQIFNRTGEKVYESYDHQFEWDGTYKGEKLAPQVFTWQMHLTWLDGHKEELRKGTLTLLK